MKDGTKNRSLIHQGKITIVPLGVTIAIVSLGMSLYEIIRQIFFPTISPWQSSLITIGVSMIITAVIVYFLLHFYRKLLQKRVQEDLSLKKRYRRSEAIVAEQTTELKKINQQLQAEIAEHRRTEKALYESEEKYRLLFESLQDVFYRTDRDGNIILVSPSIVQLLGYSRDEAMQLNVKHDIFASAEAWENFVKFTKENRYFEQFETLLKRCDGSVVWGSIKSQWYTDRSGKILGIEGVIRDIAERKRAEEVLQRRTSQLEVLRRVGLELATHLDLDELLHSIVSQAVELSGGVGGGLYFLRPAQDVLEWAVAVASNPVPLGTILHQGEGAAGKVWETGKPLVVENYQEWGGRAAIYEEYRFSSLVNVPICRGDDFLGVLTVNAEASHTFTQADIELLSLFATQAAIAIRNAQLYETERKRVRQLAVVNKVARKVASILEPAQLLQEIVTSIQQGFKYYNVILLRLDEDSKELRTRAVAGAFKDASVPGHSQPVGKGLIGSAAETGRTVLVNDVRQDPRYIAGFSGRIPTCSELCVPLKLGERVIGVLDIQDNRYNAFDTSDLTAMETLADLIVAAIENARLYKEMQQELTERKEIERALQQAKEAAEKAQHLTEDALRDAEAANRAKSEFLANMSHELRTPLNSILGYAQIFLRDKAFPEQHREMAQIMERSGEHLLMMINHVLDLSRSEAGKMELVPTDFFLHGLVKTVGEIARIQAEQKEISLDYEMAPELQICIRGDETRLRQILLNLLGNAVKFTESGNVTLRVTSLGRTRNPRKGLQRENEGWTHCIRFQIIDTGIGIPVERLADIFEPFRQVRDDRVQAKGIGLGLAISQCFVQMMGGELQVRSTLNQGSMFWFDIEFPEVESEGAGAPRSVQHIVGMEGRTRQVLLVDDDPDNRVVLKRLLVPLGFKVIEAVDGLDALEKAKAGSPDLILMDLIMPKMDGFEATRRIRALGTGHWALGAEKENPDAKTPQPPEPRTQNPEPRTQNPVIIALSANAFEQTRQKSIAAGCDDFLAKPIHVEDLFDRLERHLKLEWVYEEAHEIVLDGSFAEIGVTTSIIPPPIHELALLLDLVHKGDIMSIPESTNRIEQLDPKYIPFAIKVRQLAQAFYIDRLETFIHHYMEKHYE